MMTNENYIIYIYKYILIIYIYIYIIHTHDCCINMEVESHIKTLSRDPCFFSRSDRWKKPLRFGSRWKIVGGLTNHGYQPFGCF